MERSPYYEDLSSDFHIEYKDSTMPYKRINHIHDQLEVTFVLSEGAQAVIGEETVQVPAHTLLLFNSLDLHRIQVETGAEYTRYVFWLAPEYLSCFAQGQEYMLSCFFYRPFPQSQVLPLSPEDAEEIRLLMDRLLLANQEKAYGQSMLQKILTAELLIRINRCYLRYHGVKAEDQIQRYGSIFACIQYIHSNLDADLNLDDLAAGQFISRRRLIDQFRKVTGMSPGHYILNCRMMKARACLAQGKSVDETCAEAGFGNLSHFIRIFKKYQGITPKQYMLQNAKQTTQSGQ